MTKNYSSRLENITSLIEATCAKVGRNPDNVSVIAASKYIDSENLGEVLGAGILRLGESRWQDARQKLLHPQATEFEWHFIGHLQTNKVSYVVRSFPWIHSIDSYEKLRSVNQAALATGTKISCLLQVNVAGEATKFGMHPEQVADVVRQSLHFRGLVLRGLMTIAPKSDSVKASRSVFSATRELLLEIRSTLGLEAFDQLSMGMSQDFLVAIEEGSTMVRLGRSLFFDSQ